MRRPPFPAAGAALVLTLLGCGSRPAVVLPPLGEAVFVDPSAEHPRLKFGDGSISANDLCPITKRKLHTAFPPVHVNGMPIGFC